MNNLIAVSSNVIIRSMGEFFAQPEIAALCQAFPLTAGIAAYFGGKYSQEQFETLTTFVHLLHSRLSTVEDKYIDKEFFESQNGKRIMGKVFRGIVRDNRKEKLEAMSNLTVNVFMKSKMSIDEREIYVDILDSQNILQLSILQRSVLDMRNRSVNPHRGLGWEILFADYGKKGITKPLFLQSLRALESNGLINQNTATISEQDKTHFVTDFGEQFYDFVSDPLIKQSHYLEL